MVGLTSVVEVFAAGPPIRGIQYVPTVEYSLVSYIILSLQLSKKLWIINLILFSFTENRAFKLTHQWFRLCENNKEDNINCKVSWQWVKIFGINISRVSLYKVYKNISVKVKGHLSDWDFCRRLKRRWNSLLSSRISRGLITFT